MNNVIVKHMIKEWPKRIEDVLLPNHIAGCRESNLNDKTLLEARIYSASSVDAKKLLKRLTEVGPGYVIPYASKEGFLEHDINFKPDRPLISIKDGKKARKYLRPMGTKSRLYIPRKVWTVINNVLVPIFITEGERKALKATQEGFYTVAVSGVWNWSSNHRPIEDLDYIKWENRIVYIVFDSDKFRNKNVLLAEKHLAEALVAKGARVKIIDLPEGEQL